MAAPDLYEMIMKSPSLRLDDETARAIHNAVAKREVLTQFRAKREAESDGSIETAFAARRTTQLDELLDDRGYDPDAAPRHVERDALTEWGVMQESDRLEREAEAKIEQTKLSAFDHLLDGVSEAATLNREQRDELRTIMARHHWKGKVSREEFAKMEENIGPADFEFTATNEDFDPKSVLMGDNEDRGYEPAPVLHPDDPNAWDSPEGHQ